ncbi:NAD-dependent protein deacetylase hst1 [Zalerion maritima]|uniref:NAD-dependent protein deacetylase hst1 n=1 Tax=Zalerion maritima TaxID=339359 RepID=A0AAD5RFZ7_9PEZI|nr:NAD-dependent protein deacetylase hst1 [Zalerion maritima]
MSDSNDKKTRASARRLSDAKHPKESANMNELMERAESAQSDGWETESLFEDAMLELSDEQSLVVDVEDACTAEEAVKFRHLLRNLGPMELCSQYLDTGIISIKKLITAFGFKPPTFLEGCDDRQYLPVLMLAFSRELAKRAKLMRYNTIDDAANLIQKSKNIIVLTGAGISTSLGIPDFRSKHTGLYSKLEHLGLDDPQEVFEINNFEHDPTIFFSVARDILPSTTRYTPTHKFIAMLQQKGKLLTNYSQNIDNIEANAGVSPEKLVQCHGSFATATCRKCQYQVVGETIFDEIRAGKIPRCPKCIESLRAMGSIKRKRGPRSSAGPSASRRGSNRRYGAGSDGSDNDEAYDIPEAGILKPDITFFGEQLPDSFANRLTEHDRDLVDLVIVIGTSLKVAPVSEIVPYLPPNVPQIYISKEPVSHINFDVDLLGPCDVVVTELCKRAGWDLEHEMIPKDQIIETSLAEGYPSRHYFHGYAPKSEPTSSSSSPASVGAGCDNRANGTNGAQAHKKKVTLGEAVNGVDIKPMRRPRKSHSCTAI